MSYAAKALEAINDWEKSTGAFYIGGPFFARDFGTDGMVVFEIKNWNEGIALSLIKTPPEYRGKGLASRALKELLSFADKHGVPVTGSVSPQKDDGKTLNTTQLKAWYGRHGFKNKRHGDIYRSPAAKVVEALLGENVDPKSFALQIEPSLTEFLSQVLVRTEKDVWHGDFRGATPEQRVYLVVHRANGEYRLLAGGPVERFKDDEKGRADLLNALKQKTAGRTINRQWNDWEEYKEPVLGENIDPKSFAMEIPKGDAHLVDIVKQAYDKVLATPWRYDDQCEFHTKSHQVIYAMVAELERQTGRRALEGTKEMLYASAPKPWNREPGGVISRKYARELLASFKGCSKKVK